MNDSDFRWVDDPSPAFAKDGDVIVVWVDQEAREVVLQRFGANDRRPRFEDPTVVSGSPSVFSWLPRVSQTVDDAGDETVHVLWQEILFTGGSHGGEILYARSTDGGASFLPPLNLSNTQGGAGKGRQTRRNWHNGSLDLQASGDGAVFAAWTEYDGGLFVSRSDDNVPHALHMPSHIYVRLGHWPEVIDWNVRSSQSALNFPVGDRVSLHHIHALDYKFYGYLQQADDERAHAVLREALTTAPYQDDFIVAFHKAIMPARYAVERRDWKAAARVLPDSPDYLSWERYGWPRAISWFARGIGAVKSGDTDAAREAEAKMIALRGDAREAGEQAFETYIEVERLILSGWLAWADGDYDKAVDYIRESAALEPTVEKHPVTPGALYPPYEALGDLFMALDRPAEALEAYEAGDAIWPGRRNTLLGATRAARELGDDDQAHAFFERLLLSAGMDDHPLIVEARHFMSISANPE